MKYSITTILVILFALSSSYAQNEVTERRERSDEVKTLFSKGAKVRGFGALGIKFSEVNNDQSVLVGAKGGVIINQHMIIGLGGYGLSSVNKFDGLDPAQDLFLYGGYGGLILGYKIAPKEIFHLSFPVLIGGGGFHVSDRNYFRELNDDSEFRNEHTIENSSAFVIEPGVELEINVTKFFRIGLGGSYRIVQGVSLDRNQITDSDLTNWSTHATLKFGKFW